MHGLSVATRLGQFAAAAALALTTLATAWAASPSSDKQDGAPGHTADNLQSAVFAGGCFWGVDAVFKHVRGVSEVESGYAGGQSATADYEQVSGGATGHAEAVRVRFDPAQVSYRQLLQVFFRVAHDPTQLNRQGPDTGTQYRSAIFYTSKEQNQAALATIRQLDSTHAFAAPIVTQLAPLEHFYRAEPYHQNYLALHPDQPYIVFNDLPKLQHLRQQFPDLYK